MFKPSKNCSMQMGKTTGLRIIYAIYLANKTWTNIMAIIIWNTSMFMFIRKSLMYLLYILYSRFLASSIKLRYWGRSLYNSTTQFSHACIMARVGANIRGYIIWENIIYSLSVDHYFDISNIKIMVILRIQDRFYSTKEWQGWDAWDMKMCAQNI